MMLALYIPNQLSKFLFFVPIAGKIGSIIFNSIGVTVMAFFLYLAHKKDIDYVKHVTWINLGMNTVFMYNFWGVRDEKIDKVQTDFMEYIVFWVILANLYYLNILYH
jgi:hypothetical protein